MNVIVYHPPKSASHGHGPRARGNRKAWKAIQDFLSKHAVVELREPIRLSLWGPSQWTDSKVVELVRKEASSILGPVENVSGEFFSWELPVARLGEALEFAFADEIRPTQAIGPVSLYLSYSFTWKDMPNPTAKTEYFGRGNYLGVSIGGRRVFIQPTFLFGASDMDSDFKRKLALLEKEMPFKPKDTYYYRLEPKKTGKGEKMVKLKAGWLLDAA